MPGPTLLRSQAEIDDVLNRCSEAMDVGTHYPSSSYEEGVDAAIRWLVDVGLDAPVGEWPFDEADIGLVEED